MIFVVIGLLVLIVGAFYAAVMLAVTIPVLMVEDVRGLRACRRSYELIRKNGWRTLRSALRRRGLHRRRAILTGLVALEAANGLAADHINLWVVITQLLAALPSPSRRRFTAVVTVVIYYDCRIRKEGFDIEQLARGLELPAAEDAAGTGATPPAPVPPPPPPPGAPPGSHPGG